MGEMTDAEITEEIILRSVITLAEASYRWNKDSKAILMQVYKGRIAGRKSAGVWLVSVASVVNHYGYPVNGVEE